MIVDIRRLSGPLQADLCIVGGGAAGLCLAEAFVGSGLEVVVLEAGGLREEPASQDFFKGECAGGAHPAPEHYRIRALGGASRTWGGACVPLDPVDFSDRPWLGAAGWPIRFDELAGYYGRALAAAEGGDYDMTPTSPLAPEIEGQGFVSILERFSRPTNFAKRWGKTLEKAPNTRVLLNAPATEVRTTESGAAVAAVVVTAPDGRKIEVRSRAFVIACGGLEAPRLLLASNRTDPRGVGNHSDWLGRGYMCHVAAVVGELRFNAPASKVPYGFERDRDGVYVRRRLMLDPGVQRDRKILNLAFRLQRQDGSDPGHGDPLLSLIHLYKGLMDDGYTRTYRGTASKGSAQVLGHVGNLARAPHRLAAFAAETIKGRHLSARRYPGLPFRASQSRFAVEFHGEQAPTRDSRIRLADSVDRLGAPRIRIEWRPSPLDIETVRQAYRLLATRMSQTGAGELVYEESDLEERILSCGAYGGHHIGATRMSERPEDGVVDPDCKVHGLDNLYVASASVMPTSGQANPTLTILALTYRLADHLGDRLSPAPVANTASAAHGALVAS